jgi:hypothetical protein
LACLYASTGRTVLAPVERAGVRGLRVCTSDVDAPGTRGHLIVFLGTREARGGRATMVRATVSVTRAVTGGPEAGMHLSLAANDEGALREIDDALGQPSRREGRGRRKAS